MKYTVLILSAILAVCLVSYQSAIQVKATLENSIAHSKTEEISEKTEVSAKKTEATAPSALEANKISPMDRYQQVLKSAPRARDYMDELSDHSDEDLKSLAKDLLEELEKGPLMTDLNSESASDSDILLAAEIIYKRQAALNILLQRQIAEIEKLAELGGS